MSKFPRLLAVTGVALGGVLAVNAIAGARGLPNLFSAARAFAGAARSAKAAAKPIQVATATVGAASNPAAVAAAAAPPPAPCAPDAAELAKIAGLSSGELAMLQNLQDRDATLTAREQSEDLGAKLMDAAYAKADAKLQQLQTLKTEIDGLLKQVQDQQDAQTSKMVTTYLAMKPKDAAPQLAIMPDDVRLPIIAGIQAQNPRTLANILSAMTPAQASEITQKLTARFADQTKAGAAALAGATAPAPAAAPATAAAKPAAAVKPVAAAKPAARPAAKPAATQAAAPAAPAAAQTAATPSAAAAPAKTG